MKKGILLLLLAGSGFAQAQSLKDALFSGKLKNESGTVIRKGDDLASKMDTTTHRAAPADTAKVLAVIPADQMPAQQTTAPTDTAAASVTPSTNANDNSTAATDINNPAATTIAPAAGVTAATAAAAPKSNNVILKEYMDSVASALKTEALASKKVKKGSYFVLVTYTIDTTGQVAFGDVTLSPENEHLLEQVKAQLGGDAPRLSPVLNSAGAPRKVIKRYNFTLTKE